MVQLLRTPATLAEDKGLVLSTHIVKSKFYNSISRERCPLLDSRDTRYANVHAGKIL